MRLCRPSSGYAFAFIQKHTDAIVDRLVLGGSDPLTPAAMPRPISRFDLFLDRIFLHVIGITLKRLLNCLRRLPLQ